MRRILQTEFGRTIVYDNGIMNGITILYLHGGPGTSDPSKISGMGVSYPMITYDQYGCGGSWKPAYPDQYSLDLLVTQLREVILRLGLKEKGFALMGSSWGSFLVCAYIGRYGKDDLKGIILASPFLDDDFWQERVDKLISCLPSVEIREEIKRCRRNRVCNEESALANRGFYAEHYARNGPDFIADTDFIVNDSIFTVMMGPSDMISDGKLAGIDVSRYLVDLNIPALIIGGDHDISGSEKLFEIAASMKNCKVKIIEDSGHIIDRRIVGDIVVEFMDSISPKKETYGRYLWENDYDVILDPECILKSPDHERAEAEEMTVENCLKRAMTHETGDGGYKSYFSAMIFYEAAKMHLSEKYYKRFLNVSEPFHTQYNGKDPKRKLVFSSRGAECICCEDLASIIDDLEIDDGFETPVLIRRDSLFDGKDLKDGRVRFDRCPFCSCEVELIHTGQKELFVESECNDPDELTLLGMRYEDEGTISSICMAKELYYKACVLCIPKELEERSERVRISFMEVERGLLKNITGVLTRSSVCFESVCCKEFSENVKNIIPLDGGFYCNVESCDHWYHNIHSCPYCGATMKRVPRHY